MPAPAVSIVIPLYNREKIFAATLDSVVNQSFTDWELVVSDDGSTDEGVALARTYEAADRRIRVISNPNGGVAVARNRGLAATSDDSKFVILLDSDDVWFSDSLASMHSFLATRPDLVSVYGLAQCIDSEGKLVPGDDLEQQMLQRREYRGTQLVPIDETEPTSFAGLIYHNWVITPGIHLIRRDALSKVMPFDPLTSPADDWDLVVRLSRYGDIGFLKRLVLQWRRHPDTLTETSRRWRTAYSRARRKILLDPTNTPEQQRLAKTAFLQETKLTFAGAFQSVKQGKLGGAAHNVARGVLGSVEYVSILSELRKRQTSAT